jgi:hypothetical protein
LSAWTFVGATAEVDYSQNQNLPKGGDSAWPKSGEARRTPDGGRATTVEGGAPVAEHWDFAIFSTARQKDHLAPCVGFATSMRPILGAAAR